jgi:hypothetical protein
MFFFRRNRRNSKKLQSVSSCFVSREKNLCMKSGNPPSCEMRELTPSPQCRSLSAFNLPPCASIYLFTFHFSFSLSGSLFIPSFTPLFSRPSRIFSCNEHWQVPD